MQVSIFRKMSYEDMRSKMFEALKQENDEDLPDKELLKNFTLGKL